MRLWVLFFFAFFLIAAGAAGTASVEAQDLGAPATDTSGDASSGDTASPGASADEPAPSDSPSGDFSPNSSPSSSPSSSGSPSSGSPSSGSPSSGSPSSGSPSSGGPVVVHVHSNGPGSGTSASNQDEENEEEEPHRSPFDPYEGPQDERYYFGLFARGIYAPQFIQNIFVKGGRNFLNGAGGAFFNYRRDGFNVITEVWWAGFFGTAPFHGLNETDYETEIIESNLNVLFVSFAFMWSVPLTSFLAFEIGAGLGFGGVFGNLYRTEAYPASGGWTACTGPGNPNTQYCDPPPPTGKGSYDRIHHQPQPQNFHGGVPPLWFWADLPRIAIRINPVRQLQIRIEAGYALYGFHAGTSVGVGF